MKKYVTDLRIFKLFEKQSYNVVLKQLVNNKH